MKYTGDPRVAFPFKSYITFFYRISSKRLPPIFSSFLRNLQWKNSQLTTSNDIYKREYRVSIRLLGVDIYKMQKLLAIYETKNKIRKT